MSLLESWRQGHGDFLVNNRIYLNLLFHISLCVIWRPVLPTRGRIGILWSSLYPHHLVQNLAHRGCPLNLCYTSEPPCKSSSFFFFFFGSPSFGSILHTKFVLICLRLVSSFEMFHSLPHPPPASPPCPRLSAWIYAFISQLESRGRNEENCNISKWTESLESMRRLGFDQGGLCNCCAHHHP